MPVPVAPPAAPASAGDGVDGANDTPTAPGPALAVGKLADPATTTELANTVRTMFYTARDYRRPLMRWWRRYYEVLNMRSWSDAGPDNWQPASKIAKVWPIMSSLVAWMTDQRPILQVAPSPEPFTPYADYYQSVANDMNTAIKSSFLSNLLDAEINRVLWDVGTYGIGWVKTLWEPHLADGLGDVVFRRRDPFTIYPDPFARNPADMAYIIEARTVTLRDLDRAYPGSADALGFTRQTEDIDEAPHALDGQVNSQSLRPNYGPLAPSTSARYGSTNRGPAAKNGMRDDPTVTVLEAWIREHTIKDTSDKNVKQVVDRWRCVVVVGNVVLFNHFADECSAFADHPYDRIVLFDTGEMYGPSLVHFLASPQASINRTLNAIEHNVMLMGNPMLVESPRSQSRGQSITNRPGQRIKGVPGQDVAWLEPPQMQPQMAVQLMSYYDSQIETISGLSAIVRGFSPSGRNSSGVLDSVQDAAFVRIRATLRELERMLRGCSSKMAASIAEFYTEPRLMSIIGDDGAHLHRALQARHFYSLNLSDSGERTPLRFTLLADAGSTLPTSAQARSGDAMTLFGLGAIDRTELLKAMNWPHYTEVAQRVDAAMAAGTFQPPGKRSAAGH